MIKLPFKVSARTAKLIGQENFSNPEGAIIELVKNCYDADAKNCLVIFDIVYAVIPEKILEVDYKLLSSDLKNAYENNGENYLLNINLTPSEIDALREFYFSQNSIYIIDNGEGMSDKTIEDRWMEIGTGNKEYDFESGDGRIKTGAKGIGRFALDRLGFLSEMWTYTKTDNLDDGYYWKMNWKQFEKPNLSISDIKAELEEAKFTLNKELIDRFKEYPDIIKLVENSDFSTGTMLKISNLKDIWLEQNLDSVYKNLEALIPPKEISIPFVVDFYSLQAPKNYGLIETAFFDDYDYKVYAEFLTASLECKLTVVRNELDLKKIKKDFPTLFKNSLPPYDISTLDKKEFKITLSINELLKWEKSKTSDEKIKNVGDFNFSFYFLKILGSQKEDYPYRKINSAERKNLLNKFGGIKIYRDSFRVRPYGDLGNDWLKLGERSSASPAGAGQRIGDWRVRPSQTAGLINISRVKNNSLIDKSDRGALVENEAFDTFQKLIIGVIRYFENDRSKLLNLFYIDAKEKEEEIRKKEIRVQAEKLADVIVEERLKIEEKNIGSRNNLFTDNIKVEEKESFKKIFEETFQKIGKKEDDNAEIAQVRTLASLGLVVSSFAHELKEVKNNIDDINDLEELYIELVPDEKKNDIEYSDGIKIIKSLKVDTQKIIHWVDYSLTAIKKDKRKRGNLNFENYFKGLSSEWKNVLNTRNIEMIIQKGVTKPHIFRAFEMDMNTIFSNLISNSIDSFQNLTEMRKREIKIFFEILNDTISIDYSDTGTGLPKIFNNDKNEIFLPFISSKKDKDGNDIGTGLGMYLVMNVISDNNGEIEILDTDLGFKVNIIFPIRKNEK